MLHLPPWASTPLNSLIAEMFLPFGGTFFFPILEPRQTSLCLMKEALLLRAEAETWLGELPLWPLWPLLFLSFLQC